MCPVNEQFLHHFSSTLLQQVSASSPFLLVIVGVDDVIGSLEQQSNFPI